MIEGISGVTADLVSYALDVAALRQTVSANNLANSSTPGYDAKRVDFESLLAGVRAAVAGDGAQSLTSAIGAGRAWLASGAALQAQTGVPVKTDVEIQQISANLMWYQALLDAQSRLHGILNTAVTEGRRG